MKDYVVLLASLSLPAACGHDSERAALHDSASNVVAASASHQTDSASAGDADACAGKLPPALSQQLQSQFPRHRVPVSSDNPGWAVRMDQRSGGSGCLGIVEADFDGDDQADFAVLLSPSSGDTTSPLIVARADELSYRIDTLRVWTGLRQPLYVSALAPGRHERTKILSEDSVALEPGELKSFESKRAGVVSGALEDGAAAFFYVGQRWVHVWISD